jgi:branched-chain amino acid transport system ATP-binding protein
MLELRDIHTYYGGIHALKGVSLSLGGGEIVTLIGANGAGKSTTLMSISGVTPPRRGEIVFMDIAHPGPEPDAVFGLASSRCRREGGSSRGSLSWRTWRWART